MKTKLITLLLTAYAVLSASYLNAQDIEVENFESEVFVTAEKQEPATTADPNPVAATALNETFGGVDKTLAIEANPIQTGINDSYYAAYAVRGNGGNSDLQAEFNIESQSLTGVKYIHVMVLKPYHSTMNIAGRQNKPTTGNTWIDRFRVPAYYYTETENKWVDVVFKVDFGTGTTFDRLCIQLDNVSPATRYTENKKIYFDEIVINDSAQPRGDQTVYPAPKTSFPEDFEGASTMADKLFFGNFNYWNTTGNDLNLGTPLQVVVDNPEKNAINPTNKVLKLVRKKEATWWSRYRFVVNEGVGMEITAANRYVHIMMKKDYDSKVSFFVNTASGTKVEWIAPIKDYVKSTWQDVVFKLPDNILNQSVNLIHILPHSSDITTDADIYIDEIVFNDKPEQRGAEVILSASYDFGGLSVGQTKSVKVPFQVINGGGDVNISVEGTGFATTKTTYTQAQAEAGDSLQLSFTPTLSATPYTGKVILKVNGSTLREMSLKGESLSDNLNLNINFENGTFYAATPTNITYGGLDQVLDITANPLIEGLNTTAKCAYGIKNIAGNQDFSAEFNIEPVNIVGKKYIHVMVLKPSHSKMWLALRNNTNPDGAATSIYSAVNKYCVSTESQWVDAVFEVIGTGRKVDRLVINLDNCVPTERFTQNTNIYFDEIVMNDDPMPRGVTSVRAKKATLPETFEGETSIIDPLYFDHTYNWTSESSDLNWGRALEAVVANPAPDAINESSKVLKITRKLDATWWSRLQLKLESTIAVSESTRYLHLMFNKTTDGEVAVHFWNTDNTEAGWVRPLVNYIKGEWADLVFMIPETFTGNINRIDINPHTTGATEDMAIYIDEIEFSNSSEPRYITSAIQQNRELKAAIFAQNGKVIVDGLSSASKITIYDAMGKVISTETAVNQRYTKSIAQKFVIVKVVNGTQSVARKVILY